MRNDSPPAGYSYRRGHALEATAAALVLTAIAASFYASGALGEQNGVSLPFLYAITMAALAVVGGTAKTFAIDGVRQAVTVRDSFLGIALSERQIPFTVLEAIRFTHTAPVRLEDPLDHDGNRGDRGRYVVSLPLGDREPVEVDNFSRHEDALRVVDGLVKSTGKPLR